MSSIQTVTGPIAAKDMGRVTSHDHIFCDDRCYSGDDWKKPENEWLRRPVCMEDLGRIWYNLHKHRHSPETRRTESSFRKDRHSDCDGNWCVS